ncbi:hypothetical protein FB567DRAFT_583337 [Paraphoma chrysanthemicola]|uniref:C3H1-type domain-containing protein n=1 Tax=Paraphoma chrysanthemicola TaxID=798071 RepID=A0A8K0QZF2_9PLEO|nr:hypothetical protein FB567DRAFT_583337 [Paraphoma chrysanthemicola]
MARSARSKTVKTESNEEADISKPAGDAISATTVDSVVDTEPCTQDTATMPTEGPAQAEAVTEHVEDLIDYDDHDLESPNDKTISPSSHANTLDEKDLDGDDSTTPAPEHAQPQHVPQYEQDAETSDSVYEQAKAGMIWSISALLNHTPDIASALGLNNVGDVTSAEVTANGVTYEVTWKITSIEAAPVNVNANALIPASNGDHADETSATSALPPQSIIPDENVEQPSAAKPPPTQSTIPKEHVLQPPALTAPKAQNIIQIPSAPKCKFGRFCTKGSSCPYSHSVGLKLCTFVNTAQGCTQGAACEFSHEAVGARCTRSVTRRACANGAGCGFKHADDEVLIGGMVANAQAGPSSVKRGRGEDYGGPRKKMRGGGRGAHGRGRGCGRGRGGRGGRGSRSRGR